MALELEELRREQAGYEQQIQAVDEAMTAIQEQIDSMACTVTQNKVYVVCCCVMATLKVCMFEDKFPLFPKITGFWPFKSLFMVDRNELSSE